jgi:hypothetical protein
MRIATTMLMTLALAAGRVGGDDMDQPPPTPEQEQPEVLTSGPVHEAFAEPVNLEVQAGLVVPDEPPAAIQEVPPDEKPQGAQFVWVPGYWAWDAGRHGHIWVSACWRAAPPKMYWVPGYWARVPEGWEWVPGFWAPAGSQKIEYLPAPPPLAEVPPPASPPFEDGVWVPPCQYWYQGQYVLRAGYWLHGQPGWIWVPSHYLWTPRGYVFVAGHWDFSLERRGVLFAPVYFPRHVYARPGFSYRLGITIDIGLLRVNLFTYPRYTHYCFGDYYDDVYLRLGIYPRWESGRMHTWYDPIYQHDRWRNRRTLRAWEENERHVYDLRRADKDLRPPRTYHEMEIRQARLPQSQRKDLQIARTFTATAGTTLFKLGTLKSAERNQITRQATNVHKFGEQRKHWESPAASYKTIPPLAEPRAAVTLPSERKEPARTPGERTGPAVPSVRSASSENRSSAAATTVHAPGFVSPRTLKVTKPETVNIPRPPIVGKSARENEREVAPPPKPAAEQRSTPRAKSRDPEKNKGRDSSKSR